MSGEPTAETDRQLEALRSSERRQLLRRIRQASENGENPIDLSQIVPDSAGQDHRVALHHVHLPKLEELGYVSVEGDRERVGRGPAFDRIEPLLRFLDDYPERAAD